LINRINHDHDPRIKTSQLDCDFSSMSEYSSNFSVSGTRDIAGKSRITVVCQSSSSSENRLLNIATSPENVLATAPAPGSSLEMTVYEYTGSGTEIYLFSSSSGVNIYHVRVEELRYTGQTTVNPVNDSDSKIISEKYYNFSGIYLGNNSDVLQSGMYIKVIRFENGTVKSEKFFRNNR